MEALNIDRPVLVGHSMAGEELSSVGSRFPDKVSGLIYLDAATDFALDDPEHPLLAVEMNDIERRIDEIEASGVDEKKKLLELETAVATFEAVLHHDNAEIANMPPLPPRSPISAALNFGMQKYTSIPVPALAIYALILICGIPNLALTFFLPPMNRTRPRTTTHFKSSSWSPGALWKRDLGRW